MITAQPTVEAFDTNVTETPTDGQLLASVASTQSHDCFGQLVERHGTMVLGVCRRQLPVAHDAEDAAQAVFVVLWKKAANLRGRTSVAGWLHHVARNVCRNARKAAAVRQKHEQRAAEMNDGQIVNEADWSEIKDVLDEELSRLPEKYRLPVILCHLQGHTHEEVAALTGVKESTVSTRLSRARELLRARLARRGITIGSIGLATALAANTCSAAVPASFVTSTTQAAALFAAGKLAAGGALSAKTAALAQGAIHMLTIAKMKTAAAVLVTASVVAGGGAVVVQQMANAQDAAKVDYKNDLTPTTYRQIHSVVQPSDDEWRHMKVNWLTDIVAARKKAAEEDKPIVYRRIGGAGFVNPFGPC